MRASVELEFGDGQYLFRLNLAGIREIQDKTGCGFGEVTARVLSGVYEGDAPGSLFGLPTQGKWKVEDLVELVRQGLIGGGKGTVDGQPVEVTALVANRLIQNYVMERPLGEAWKIAAAVALAAVEGVEDREHEVKKKSERSSKRKMTKGGSTTPGQSGTAPSATSVRKRPAVSPSENTTP